MWGRIGVSHRLIASEVLTVTRRFPSFREASAFAREFSTENHVQCRLIREDAGWRVESEGTVALSPTPRVAARLEKPTRDVRPPPDYDDPPF